MVPVVSCGSNLLIERATFDSLRGFDDRLPPAEDWEFLVRLVAASVGIAYVDEPLVAYRWHAGNATRDLAELERSLERAYGLILGHLEGDLNISRRQADGGMHKMLAVAALRMGHWERAIAHGLQAAPRDPGGIARQCQEGPQSPAG